jgi:ribose transport system substrate-binding protein
MKVRCGIAAALIAVAVSVMADASSGFAKVRGFSSSTASAAAASGCGSIPYVAPDDPKGILKKLSLPSQVNGFYEGWNVALGKSAWANWKPTHKGKLKVAIVAGVDVNAFYSELEAAMVRDLKANPMINPNITVTNPSSFSAIGEQLQQYEAAVQQHANLIIFDPISPTAAAADVTAAGKKGIPTISYFNDIPSSYDIGVTANSYTSAAGVASLMVKDLGGNGSILEVLGDPQAPTTVYEQQDWRKVFAKCKGISLAGSVTGEYETTVAKTATLQFLSTHTGSVNGVIQSAEMATGVLQAFQQAGRPVPVIGQIGGERAVMAYWSQHAKQGYKGAVLTGGGDDYGALVSGIALRTLAGQGPRIDQFPWPYGPVTNSTLSQFVRADWTVNSLGGVDNIAKYEWSTADLNLMFNRPKLTLTSK